MKNKAPPIFRPAWQEAPADRLRRIHRTGDAMRPPAHLRGYDWHWSKVRGAFIKAHPWCAMCLAEGRETPAQIVDHIIGVKDAPHLRLNPGNLRSLCRPCHTRRTAADPTGGGFGKRGQA